MLDSGFVLTQLSSEQYKVGPIPNHPLKSVFEVITQNGPSARAIADGIQRAVVLNANGTAQSVKGAPGIVYHIRVENTDNDAIIVRVLDGTVVRAVCFCAGATTTPAIPIKVGETAVFADDAASPGVGVPFATSINVTAVKASDGSTAADNGATVRVIYK